MILEEFREVQELKRLGMTCLNPRSFALLTPVHCGQRQITSLHFRRQLSRIKIASGWCDARCKAPALRIFQVSDANLQLVSIQFAYRILRIT